LTNVIYFQTLKKGGGEGGKKKIEQTAWREGNVPVWEFMLEEVFHPYGLANNRGESKGHQRI